jgi:hypothetical protein
LAQILFTELEIQDLNSSDDELESLQASRTAKICKWHNKYRSISLYGVKIQGETDQEYSFVNEFIEEAANLSTFTNMDIRLISIFEIQNTKLE